MFKVLLHDMLQFLANCRIACIIFLCLGIVQLVSSIFIRTEIMYIIKAYLGMILLFVYTNQHISQFQQDDYHVLVLLLHLHVESMHYDDSEMSLFDNVQLNFLYKFLNSSYRTHIFIKYKTNKLISTFQKLSSFIFCASHENTGTYSPTILLLTLVFLFGLKNQVLM